MLNWLRRSLLLLVFTQITPLSAAPVPLVMPPLPPPGWITVTNITPTSATVTWEAVGSGTVWYNTRLEETATGLLVQQDIQTQTSRNYDGLTPGVSYTFKVSASTSQNGPWGPQAIKEFRTTVIVLDDICNLNNNAQGPNQQPLFNSADKPASNGNYFLCMPKVNLSGTNWSRLEHAFYASLQPNTSHFYEFAMIAGTDNGLHFSKDPVIIQGNNMVWTTKYFGANGQEYFPGALGSQGSPNVPPPIVTVEIYYGPAVPAPTDLQLSLSINELPTTESNMTVAVNIPYNNVVHHSNNECKLGNTPCPDNSGGGNNIKGKAALDATTIASESLNNPEKNPDAASAQVQANDHNASSLVSPNPFHSVLQLNLADYSRDLEQVRILNPQGQVMVQLGKNQLNDQVIQIVTDDWIPCMYYLQVLSSSGILSVPVVKM